MKLFTELYVELDQTNKTNEKVEAMKFYFEHAAPHDAAWALYFLSGRKPRQIVPSRFLRDWSIERPACPNGSITNRVTRWAMVPRQALSFCQITIEQI
jgi:hypothetical protein